MFASLLKDVSLRKRVSLMSLRNKAGVACKDIVNRGHMDHDFFHTSVLCDNEAIQLEGDRMIIKYDRKTAVHGKSRIEEYLHLRSDELILMVVRYLLNLYDIRLSVTLNDNSACAFNELLLFHSSTTADEKLSSPSVS